MRTRSRRWRRGRPEDFHIVFHEPPKGLSSFLAVPAYSKQQQFLNFNNGLKKFVMASAGEPRLTHGNAKALNK